MSNVFMIGYDLKKVKNTTDHHTESYDGDNSVVLRRGKEFSFELHFSGPFKLTENNFVEIELTRGTNPQLSDATKFLIHFSETEKKGGSGDYNWKGDIEHLSDTRVDVTVSIPSNCPIGSYEMLVTTSSGVNYSRPTRESIVILFNPWNEDDGVYMESEAEGKEYVLNNNGMIFCGSLQIPISVHWNYAQFETVCWETALNMLNKKFLNSDARRDPIQVCRSLAEMINYNGFDNGVLVGKWWSLGDDPAYNDGIPPSLWTGTEAIFTQYVKSDYKAVKYAQSWVYAGVLTTVLRALGIPARPVTNYESAYDTEDEQKYYFDKKGEMVSGHSTATIWNFHVWVDVWMNRPDLRDDYTAREWQVLDATPRKTGNRTIDAMVTGPASVRAIKERKELHYDTKCVIDELNANINCFFQTETSYESAQPDKAHSKGLVVTKEVGEFSRADITESYKSIEESHKAKILKNTDKQRSITFTVDPSDELEYGNAVTFTVRATLPTSDNYTVSVIATIQPVDYIGRVGKVIKKFRDEKRVFQAKGQEKFEIIVSPDEYENILSSETKLRCTAIASVEEHQQIWVGKATQEFAKSRIQFELPSNYESVEIGKSFAVKMHFTNPLKIPLTELKWAVEGSGLMDPQIITNPSSSTVNPGMIAQLQVELKPSRRIHNQMLVAKFHCKQLGEIMGYKSIEVK